MIAAPTESIIETRVLTQTSVTGLEGLQSDGAAAQRRKSGGPSTTCFCLLGQTRTPIGYRAPE
jgi:hypothetical protein